MTSLEIIKRYSFCNIFDSIEFFLLQNAFDPVYNTAIHLCICIANNLILVCTTFCSAILDQLFHASAREDILTTNFPFGGRAETLPSGYTKDYKSKLS